MRATRSVKLIKLIRIARMLKMLRLLRLAKGLKVVNLLMEGDNVRGTGFLRDRTIPCSPLQPPPDLRATPRGRARAPLHARARTLHDALSASRARRRRS